MNRGFAIVSGFVALGVVAAAPAQASLVGSTVSVVFDYNGSSYGSASGVVPLGGLTFPFGTFPTYSSNEYVTINGSTITVGQRDGTGYSPGTFNGPIFTISPASTLTATLLSSSGIGFAQSLITVVGNTISLNFQNLSANNAHSVTIDVSTGVAVPEPTALALFGFGLVGVAVARRRIGA